MRGWVKWQRGEAPTCACCPVLMALPRGLQQVIAARPAPASLLRHSARMQKCCNTVDARIFIKTLFSTVMNKKNTTTPTLVPDSHSLHRCSRSHPTSVTSMPRPQAHGTATGRYPLKAHPLFSFQHSLLGRCCWEWEQEAMLHHRTLPQPEGAPQGLIEPGQLSFRY